MVVTNQITGQIGVGGVAFALAPALGNTWSHCVSHRLSLTIDPDPVPDLGDRDHHPAADRRTATIVKSCLAPPVAVGYRVTAAGVVPLLGDGEGEDMSSSLSDLKATSTKCN